VAQVGKLWTSLADYYIRQGMMEKARDIYEEGLNTVTTVRDFSLIFDTLTHFEESLITYKLQQQADEEEVAEDDDSDGENFILKDNVADLDLRWAPNDPPPPSKSNIIALVFSIAKKPGMYLI